MITLQWDRKLIRQKSIIIRPYGVNILSQQ